MKRPAFQFYPADWRKDVALQSCSMAAQGLWINAMCLAHECEPYGHLIINSKAMTPAQLGRQVGLSAKEADALVLELADAGVLDRLPDGTIYSRRMVRDERIRNVRADAGRLGGNPNLLKQKDNQEVNQSANLDLTPSSSSSSSSSTSVKKEPNGSMSPAKLPTCKTAGVIDLYHDILPELPRAKLQTKSRERAIRKVWDWTLTSKKMGGERRAETSEQALDWFRGFFTRARDNDFLMGRTAKTGDHANWQCDLDFLLSEKGMKQVIEKTKESA